MNSLILCDLTQECRNKYFIGTDCLESVSTIQQRVERVQLQGSLKVGKQDTLVFLICLMSLGAASFSKET